MIEARRDLVEFFLAEDGLEQAAGVGNADQGDVAGIGNVAREKHPYHPLPGLALQLAVHHGIAPGTEHPQEFFFRALQHASCDQAFDGLFLNGLSLLFGNDLQPGCGVPDLSAAADASQHLVQYGVLREGRIDDDQLLRIGVDAIGKGQVHQDAAHQGVLQSVLADRQEGAGLVVEKKRKSLFGECNH